MDDGTPIALSFAQQRMWLLDRMFPGEAAYNQSHAARLTGDLDADALRRALNEVVRRHEVLRTHFAVEDGQPVAVIEDELPVPLPVEDLRALAPAERAGQARRRAATEAGAPFDLARAPLLRARLLRLGETEHWLLLTVHHIATDGWSNGVLWAELAVLYGACGRGEPSPLPELPVQYADYAAWQRKCLQGGALAEHVAFWKGALAHLPALDLPTDRPRPLQASHRGASVVVAIDADLTSALKLLSRSEGATLFMTLLTAFQILLHRYTGQDDFAVGVPAAGRNRPELEGLIGFFVNTLVLRADLSGNPTFSACLARVRRCALDAYSHAELPFEQLVAALAPSRDLSRNPLFQVLFGLRNTPPAPWRLPGLAVERVHGLGVESAKFDLSVQVTETGGSLSMEAEHAVDLFDGATIQRLMGHFQTLLRGIVADPARPISRLPLLADAQPEVEWNDTACAGTRETFVAQLFEQQVARAPDATAVVFGQRQLSYAELNARANRLAHQLRALGVAPEVPVAVVMERSFELPVALLGILKAGGAYVPLDPVHPVERLAFLLADVAAPVVLTQRQLATQLPARAAQTLCVDEDGPLVAAQQDTNPPCVVTAASLAYVIHTSGSTGQPKGVMIEQQALANHIAWMKQRFSPGAHDCVLLTSAIGFDQSIWQMLFALVSGARLALPDVAAHRSADEIVAAIRRDGVTVLRIVPTMLGAILDGPGLGQCSSLRLVIVAGEPLERAVAAAFAAQCGAQLVNAYGPTEATFVSTLHSFHQERDAGRVPIGRPIGNVRIHLLDRYDQPLPLGAQGEVCIAGDGVGRGYWRRPELTARAFVKDPFDAEPRARMYRTGDFARYRPDGNLEFLGRRDQQIKIRGIRVELGEIEAAAGQHPQVRQCAVNPWKDATGDERLVAYLVARGTTGIDAVELREFLRAKLPPYMIPAIAVSLPELPLTPSGKVDRQALPAPRSEDLAATGNRHVAPRGGIETRLAQIWKEVLGLSHFGVDDDFFELGGHSLLAMRVLARIELELGAALTVYDFFAAPRIASLAEVVARARPELVSAGAAIPGLAARADGAFAP